MGLIDSLKLKKVTRYGLVEQGKYFMSEVALERDVGEKNKNSDNIIFLKENTVLFFPWGYKIIGSKSVGNIAELKNYPKQADGTARLTLIFGGGEEITINFPTNRQKISFLYKLQDIQKSKSDLVKEIENIK